MRLDHGIRIVGSPQMVQCLVTILLSFTFAGAAEVHPEKITLGKVQYELSDKGDLTITSPDYSRPLKIEARYPIRRLIPIRDRMFIEDGYDFGYMVVLPGIRSFVTRHLIRMLNSNPGERFFVGNWTEKYRTELIPLHDSWNIHGEVRVADSHIYLNKDNGPDIILSVFENKFSVRKLLEELDADQSTKLSVCDKFLKAIPH